MLRSLQQLFLEYKVFWETMWLCKKIKVVMSKNLNLRDAIVSASVSSQIVYSNYRLFFLLRHIHCFFSPAISVACQFYCSFIGGLKQSPGSKNQRNALHLNIMARWNVLVHFGSVRNDKYLILMSMFQQKLIKLKL